MKIKLSESKERIPTEFLTSLVSKYWEEVSALNAEIEAIGKDFTNTKEIKEALQDLSDAYLIAIGRFQNYMSDKNILSIPDAEEQNESLKENLAEDAHIDIDKVEINVEQPHVDFIDNDDILAGEFDDDPSVEVRPIKTATVAKPTSKQVQKPVEEFDYFCDFEDSDPNERPITDAELYPEPKM